MIYQIMRTSRGYDADPEVDGAELQEGSRTWDTGYESLHALRSHKLKPFSDVDDDRFYMEDGTLHFNRPATFWVIDSPDIHTLMDKYGILILRSSDKFGISYCIEIYDDYRE